MTSLHHRALHVLFGALGSALAAGAIPAALHAQQPVVFVHGLRSSGEAWDPAAARVERELDVQTVRPTQSWSQPYQHQATELQNNPQTGGLPPSAIAFGHSNGGVVAREWSKLHGLRGLATIGTPHQGAPFVSHIYDWVNFNDSARILDEGILNAFGTPYNQHLQWVLGAAVNQGISWVRWFRGYATYQLMYLLGFDAASPVVSQMRPPSAFLAALNSDGNIAREAHTVAHRVGIVNVPPNYLFGGPVRLIVPPEYADEAAIALHVAGAFLYYYGAYVQGNADLDDPMGLADASEKSNLLMELGQWINEIELTWCSMVSSTGPARGGACTANDSLVPWTSQVYPGAYNAVFYGPSHTWETQYSGDAIFWTLHDIMGVQPRQVSPPPPPSPGPNGTDVLAPFDTLYPDNWRTSSNGRYKLYYQTGGNLVVLRDEIHAIWATDTGSPGTVTMQGDGNLVMLDADGNYVWSSNTWGNDGAFLVMQGDGNLVIYTADGRAIWATGTNGR
jgi:pimeloyl-ACP methyl ester carboxylesterase